MWGGWPFNLFGKDPLVAGVALLAGAYVVTWVVFRVFFNYDFMQGAPVYLASAPQGLFNAVSALVFYVTALAVMFLVLCFDLWPFTKVPSLMQQPTLGPGVDDRLRRRRVDRHADRGRRRGAWTR